MNVSPLNRWHQIVLLTIAALLMVALTACGGGGVIPGPGVQTPRTLPDELSSKPSVAYSPFRTSNRDTEVISRAQVVEDLKLLEKAGFGVIRLFDASDSVAKLVLEVIQQDGIALKVWLGMYVNPGAEAANQAELDRGIALANRFKAHVIALSVGNETLVSWSFVPQTPETIAGYLRKVRSAVSQPVTTNDNWAFFANAQSVKPANLVLKEIDFVAMHSYPLLDTIYNPGLWDWQQSSVPETGRAQAMIDAAVARTKFEFAAVKANLTSLGYPTMPIVIGETGWKAVPSGGEVQRAHPVNQRTYFEAMEAWKQDPNGPLGVVHFEAFDEPWKNSDDKWGFFDVGRRARCVAQSMASGFIAAPDSCEAAAAVYFKPTENQGAVTADRYSVFSEIVDSAMAKPSQDFVLNAWENGTTAKAEQVAENSGDGSTAIRVNPTPLSWGWGMTWSLSNQEVDLSAFEGSSGRIEFLIKTTYKGKLEFGFLTGGALDGTAYDVYLPVSPGEYGYQNDGSWHKVSIPMAAVIAKGAMAYGMTDPTQSRLNLKRVSNAFVVADRYAVTGNASGQAVPVYIDQIIWSR